MGGWGRNYRAEYSRGVLCRVSTRRYAGGYDSFRGFFNSSRILQSPIEKMLRGCFAAKLPCSVAPMGVSVYFYVYQFDIAFAFSLFDLIPEDSVFFICTGLLRQIELNFGNLEPISKSVWAQQSTTLSDLICRSCRTSRVQESPQFPQLRSLFHRANPASPPAVPSKRSPAFVRPIASWPSYLARYILTYGVTIRIQKPST